MSAKKQTQTEKEVDMPQGGSFGLCDCGQPVHNLQDYIGQQIKILSYSQVAGFKMPVVVLSIETSDGNHKAYTFSSVVQNQLKQADEYFAKGIKVRATPRREKRYLTLR
jgi:hypothetical protein